MFVNYHSPLISCNKVVEEWNRNAILCYWTAYVYLVQLRLWSTLANNILFILQDDEEGGQTGLDELDEWMQVKYSILIVCKFLLIDACYLQCPEMWVVWKSPAITWLGWQMLSIFFCLLSQEYSCVISILIQNTFNCNSQDFCYKSNFLWVG